MDLIEFMVNFGFSISLVVNAFLFIPQVISILKSQSAKGVSLLTFAGFNVIQLFTILHGLYIHDYLLVGGFLLSFITCGAVTLLVFYMRYIKKAP